MIIGIKIRLRAIEEGDLFKLNQWSNDPEIWKDLGGWHFPYTLESTRAWFEELSAAKTDQYFAITDDKGVLLGTATLNDIDWKNRTAFHGMMLGAPESRGKGYGTDTISTLMRYAFEELGLNRLDGSMIERNLASLKVYLEKCGWKQEGIQRQWYFRDNRYWNRILVGITKADYDEWKAART